MQLSEKGTVQNQYFLMERCPSEKSFFVIRNNYSAQTVAVPAFFPVPSAV